MGEFLEPVGGDLIIVRQLPVIEDKMEEALASIKGRLDAMSNLAVTEENCREIKKVRAELNKEFAQLERLRKDVKSAIEVPYKKFEGGAYKKMADAYRAAINQLDGNIKDVESELKMRRQRELFEYFEAYRQSLGIDGKLADPRRSGINIGLSGSMTSYKKAIKEFIDRIASDLKTIDALENRDEIMAEYRLTLDLNSAVQTVKDRLEREEAERLEREALEVERKLRAAREAVVEAAIAEAVVAPEETPVAPEEAAEQAPEILHAQYLKYDIYGTLEQLKGMKNAMIDCMIDFCEREGMTYGKCSE